MKKNDMLNESTIRRFMKLATIDGLSDKFVADEEIEEAKHEDDEKMEESEEELTFEEEDLEERGMMSMDRDDDMDMGEPEEAAGAMVSVDQLMAALEKALEDVLGQEVEVSQDDDEVDMDMGDMDMDPPDAGDELGLDAEATPKTDVVEEVYARVIQRLTQETKSNKK